VNVSSYGLASIINVACYCLIAPTETPCLSHSPIQFSDSTQTTSLPHLAFMPVYDKSTGSGFTDTVPTSTKPMDCVATPLLALDSNRTI